MSQHLLEQALQDRKALDQKLVLLRETLLNRITEGMAFVIEAENALRYGDKVSKRNPWRDDRAAAIQQINASGNAAIANINAYRAMFGGTLSAMLQSGRLRAMKQLHVVYDGKIEEQPCNPTNPIPGGHAFTDEIFLVGTL